MRLLGTMALATALVFWSGVSRADDADRTFQEALSLYDAGKIPEACAKFAESYAIDPAMGTLQNLAACHEREGKRALALREWLDLAERAESAGKAAPEALARTHVVDLSTRLPRIVVRVDPRSGVDRVELDDQTLDTGREVAVDPGRHRIVFSGAGRIPATRTVEPLEGRVLELDAPMLESSAAPTPAPATMPTTPAPVAHERGTSPGWILLGIGGASFTAGAAFGVAALLQRSASDDHCPQDRCTRRGVELNDDAKVSAWGANLGLGLGLGLAAAAGLYLLLERPTRSARSPR